MWCQANSASKDIALVLRYKTSHLSLVSNKMLNVLVLPRKRKSFPSLTAHRAMPISVSLAVSQTPLFTPQDHRYGASASRGMPVYVPAFAGKLLIVHTHGGMARLS